MKRLSVFVLLLIACSTSYSQTIADVITARKSLKLRGNKVDSIGVDSISAYGSNNKLITERAAKAFARNAGGVNGNALKDSIQNVVNYLTLDSVSNFVTFSSYAKSVIVSNKYTGGVFTRYFGSDVADNGMIFSDAIGRKWKRQVSDATINVLWYGARQNGIDCRAKVISAINYIYNHSDFTTLYFPNDSSVTPAANVYYFPDSLLITKSLKIKGDGYYKNPQSQLYFGNHKSGLIFKFNYGESAIYNSIENIHLHCPGGAPYDLNKHGIRTNSQIYINNVYVEGFDGDGLHMSACSIVPNGNNNNYGNCNNSTIIDLKVDGVTNGVFMEGCDVNKIKFYGLDATGCRRWMSFDNGMLGNDYYSPHSGGNGSASLSVIYGGKYYAAVPGHDSYFQDAADSNYNKQPDINLGTYWIEVPPMANTGAWSPTTRYYSGGPIAVVGPNAWTNIYNAYTEGPTAPIYLNSRSKVDGGTPGAGVVNGTWWNMYQGYQYVNNGSLVVTTGRLSVGTDPDPSTSFHSKANSGIALSGLFESIGSFSSVKFKNATHNGQLVLWGPDWQLYEGTTLRASMTATSFSPGSHNTFDIGEASNRWKNSYAVQIFGDQISVGTTSTDASAIANIVSTTKGVLLPRMTTTQRTAIPTPTEGLEVYDLTLHKKYVFDGTIWQACW